MIAIDWPGSSDRYGRVQHFVDMLFAKIAEFQEPPHHPKWYEVNLAASLPNWARLLAAQEWLDGNQPHEAPRVSIVARLATPARPENRVIGPEIMTG